MRGEINYGLAYLTLILCQCQPAFVEIFLGAIESACPFIRPGLKEYWEKEAQTKNWSKEMRKKKLGYKDEFEGDDNYIFRMQTLVSFYGAMLQTSPKLLESYLKMVGMSSAEVKENPLGGLAEAWRWLAKTVNGNKWRWTRFLIHAFICVTGRDLSLAIPKQMIKLLNLLISPDFKKTCEKSASHPQDDDRINAFEKYFKEAVRVLVEEGAMKPPGRYDEVDGERFFVDPRNLPEGAIHNTG
jgi:hypothetical protein